MRDAHDDRGQRRTLVSGVVKENTGGCGYYNKRPGTQVRPGPGVIYRAWNCQRRHSQASGAAVG
ncbi:hypothetical protein Hsero_3892 [Herbaspirillum seropedicae SmR1]|uniref:Uncharacterized protein n=1 Tax=Herbaspirillum seropedicae (strain SmR1) TaxID=757424 RepID=D8IS22_HERSS|nr:hypothetical protein Hsero_3892 [Herbaspirillum seropedicae SmR1]